MFESSVLKADKNVSSPSILFRFFPHFICPIPDNLPDGSRWPNLKAIRIAINTTIRDGKTHTEILDYVLSRYISGRCFGVVVRTDWGIEYSLPFEQAKRNLALAT